MKEIEIKFEVDDLAHIREVFEKQGVSFSNPVHQIDSWFTDPEVAKNFDIFASGKNFVRIRTEDQKHLLTLKIPQKNEMDCREFQTSISDPLQAEEILNALGLVKVVTFSKERIVGKDGEISICLDAVKDLGSFIELEKMVAVHEDGESVQESLRAYLREKNIPTKNEVFHGYDTLTYKKTTE